jgi:hypothetical protein
LKKGVVSSAAVRIRLVIFDLRYSSHFFYTNIIAQTGGVRGER